MIAGELNMDFERVEMATPGEWLRWADLALTRHLTQMVGLGLDPKEAEEMRESYLLGTDYTARQAARRAGAEFMRRVK